MRRKVKTVWLGLGFGLAVAYAGRTEEAPLILAPVYAGARTTHTWLTNFVSPQYMIDNSGMTGLGRDATHTNANAKWLFWHSAELTTVQNEWVEFDLGETYRVTNALIWQMAQADNTGRGVQSFSILVAGPDKVYTTVSVSNTLAKAGGAANEPVQAVPLVADDVRWVRFNIHTNWGSSPIVVGLGEVRFEVYPVPPQPEPEQEVLIVAPNSATASTTYDMVNYGPSLMIDNSGMTGTGRDATHTNRNATMLFWHSAVGATVSQQWVEFDLLEVYDLTNALIWQLAQTNLTTRGIKAFTLQTAGEDQVFTTHSSAQLAQATGGPNEPVQIVPLSVQNVRYVRFQIQSNWGAGGIVGLSEVRFEAVGVSENNNRLIAPTDVTASSIYNSLNYGPQYLIDNSGMTGAGREATHTHLNAPGLLWHSVPGSVHADQWLEFDLGNTYGLHYALIWQLAQSNNTSRGVRSFTIKTAGPDRVFSAVSASNVLTRASGLSEEEVQVKPAMAEQVRYVQLDIHSNWGGDCVGLSEVRFEVTPPATNGTLRSQVACNVSSEATGYPKAALLDGAGLSGDGLCATHTNGTGSGSMWLSGFGTVTNAWIAFDFGREIDLTAAAVWQYSQTAFMDGSLALGGLKRGVRWMTLHVAGNDQNFSEFGKVELDQGSGLAAQPAQFVGLMAAGVRYVKFQVDSNWGDPNYVGLAEVRFIYDRHVGTVIRVH